jgi:hypothetical protein
VVNQSNNDLSAFTVIQFSFSAGAFAPLSIFMLSHNWRAPTRLAKILRIFKKIKSLSAYAPAIKNFGKNFIFPFTPPRFWQKFLLSSNYFRIFLTLACYLVTCKICPVTGQKTMQRKLLIRNVELLKREYQFLSRLVQVCIYVVTQYLLFVTAR